MGMATFPDTDSAISITGPSDSMEFKPSVTDSNGTSQVSTPLTEQEPIIPETMSDLKATPEKESEGAADAKGVALDVDLPSVALKGPEISNGGTTRGFKLFHDAPDHKDGTAGIAVNGKAPKATLDTDASGGELEVEVAKPKLDIHLPSAGTALDMKGPETDMPSFGTKSDTSMHGGSVEINVPSVEVEKKKGKKGKKGKKLKDKLGAKGSAEVEVPGVSAKKPELDTSGPSGKIDLNLPDVTVPKIEFKGKTTNAGIDAQLPNVDMEGKTLKADVTAPSGNVDLEKPSSLPIFGFKGKLPEA